MPPIVAFIVYLCLFIGVYLVVDAVVGFIRVAGGEDDAAIERRLANPSARRLHGGDVQYDILRSRGDTGPWQEYIPFYPRFLRLLETSGTGLTFQRAVGFMAAVTLVVFVPIVLLLPLRFAILAFLIAPVIGVSSVILSVMKARTNRIRKFEEQLPDAIDLIVRSLKIGHPLSGSMSVVARELPTPISSEFAAAFEQVTYGQEIPSAFAAMSERVP